ncbi:hypothetical protein LCGC14_1772460 [marine sediment metagenome]|uniref:Uncharacterized protein n=1 Tax=marine sediment metagenome TaxID=412755 RepID=A0A0F9HKB4_9ZZZZ
MIKNWRANHSGSDLDAHHFEFAEEIRTGVALFPVPVETAGTTRAMTANRLFAMPWYVPRAITVDELLIEVTSAGAGATYARLGIYNVGTNLYPGTLKLDGGTVLTDSNAVVSLAISQALTKGLYFLAVICSGTPTIRGWKPTWTPLGSRSNSLDFVTASVYIDSEDPTELPDPFGTPTADFHEGYGNYAISSLD